MVKLSCVTHLLNCVWMIIYYFYWINIFTNRTSLRNFGFCSHYWKSLISQYWIKDPLKKLTRTYHTTFKGHLSLYRVFEAYRTQSREVTFRIVLKLMCESVYRTCRIRFHRGWGWIGWFSCRESSERKWELESVVTGSRRRSTDWIRGIFCCSLTICMRIDLSYAFNYAIRSVMGFIMQMLVNNYKINFAYLISFLFSFQIACRFRFWII